MRVALNSFFLQPETPIVERYWFPKKEQVAFDTKGFINYLQTLDGGNKDYEPAKAIAAHVKGHFGLNQQQNIHIWHC